MAFATVRPPLNSEPPELTDATAILRPPMSQETGAWMPMYWADYFGDTLHLTTAEHGAYLLLIGAYWRRGGPLPDDDKYLANVARASRKTWISLRPPVSFFFSLGDGVWTHHRVEKEILRSSGRLISARAAGQAGGLAKSKLVTVTVTEEKNLSATQREPARPKRSRLSPDWMLSPEGADYARERGFGDQQVLDIAEAFKTYWTAGAGATKTHADWAAAWRVWVAREKPHTQGGYVNGSRPSKQGPLEALVAGFARTAREIEGKG